jgi:hypothetical protein
LLSEILTRRYRHYFGAGVHFGRVHPKQRAKAIRNLSVTLVGGVLVAQRRRMCPVTEAVY